MSDRRQVVKQLAQVLVAQLKSRLIGAGSEISRSGIGTVVKMREFAQQNITDWRKVQHQTTGQVFPEGTRFVKSGGNTVVLAIEQKPTIRTLHLDSRLMTNLKTDSERAGQPKTRCQLSLPYVIFIIQALVAKTGYQYQTLRVYFRQTPLRSPSDSLGHTILPNMSGSVCMGGQWSGATGTLVEIAEKVITHYWNTSFTMDYPDYWFQISKRVPQLMNLQAWIDATEADPDFILGVKWEEGPKLESIFQESVDMTEITPADASFIQSITSEFELEISKMLDQATRLDGASLDLLTQVLDEALGEGPSKKNEDEQITVPISVQVSLGEPELKTGN